VTTPALKVQEGDVFTLNIPQLETSPAAPQPMALDIAYEDDDIIVINKPAGLVVHPGAGNEDGTLVNALVAHCGDSLSGIGGVARPGIVHRIDKDTSGLLVVAKHDDAHHGLAEAFAAHDIDRVYIAFVQGALRPGVGTIETLMGRSHTDRKKMAVVPWEEEDKRSDARHAITHYQTMVRFGVGRAKLAGDALASRLECRLETGRTHQIRVHMAHLGAPLIGDPVYGRGPGLAGLRPVDAPAQRLIRVLGKFQRQALHAAVLGFKHPISGAPLRFESPLPADLLALEEALSALTGVSEKRPQH